MNLSLVTVNRSKPGIKFYAWFAPQLSTGKAAMKFQAEIAFQNAINLYAID
jgi:hypothetical protein